MGRLISLNAFKTKLHQMNCIDKYGRVLIYITDLIIALEKCEVDAVEVVRCKDCYYCRSFNEVWELPKRNFTVCIRSNNVVESEDYCSWGVWNEID